MGLSNKPDVLLDQLKKTLRITDSVWSLGLVNIKLDVLKRCAGNSSKSNDAEIYFSRCQEILLCKAGGGTTHRQQTQYLIRHQHSVYVITPIFITPSV